MININTVTLVGRLTKEIDLRKTPSNKSTCTFTIAVNRRFKQDGQQEADFIQVVAWNQSADFLSKYAHKGTEVSVEGRIATRSYDKEGKKIYVTEVIAEHVMIGAAAKESQQQDISGFDDSAMFGGEKSNITENLDISSDDLPFY